MKACAGELRTARGLMDATPLSLRLDNAVRRPELGPLLAMVAMLLDTQPTLVLHITAARHGEGTTTLARDLAAAAARARWRQVALIDAGHNTDSAALPTLLDPFERGRPASLAAGWLAGETVALGRLAAPGDPAPRIESLRGLLAGLRAQYGVIILDAPPVLAAREAAVLARLADGVLLVLAAERTKLADARQARAILEQLGATILGVVLNRRRARLPGLVDRLTK